MKKKNGGYICNDLVLDSCQIRKTFFIVHFRQNTRIRGLEYNITTLWSLVQFAVCPWTLSVVTWL